MGALIGVFAVGSFVVHNYVNLQIGIGLSVRQGIAYFVEWVIVGVVIGLIYRPATEIVAQSPGKWAKLGRGQ